MTIADVLIPYYYWFKNGFGEISLPMGLISFASIIIVLLAQKGIEISMIMIPFVAVAICGLCTGIGWFMQTYDINSRMAILVTTKQHPMLNEMYEDIKSIKKQLEETK